MRREVGRHLFQDVVAVAAREHVQRVEVTANPHVRAFYENVGFHPRQAKSKPASE